MRVFSNPPESQWPSLVRRPESDNRDAASAVQEILQRVRKEGDRAVKYYNQRFDNWGGDLAVPGQELANAESQLSPGLKEAILLAAENIRRFHRARLASDVRIETLPGVACWTKSVPLQRIGLYIPGGSAPLFSTVLMLGLPATIAGCPDIVLCTPPGQDGAVHPAILFAAGLCGINCVLRVGGAQAIGAMAYGTESIQAVDKILGPGNRFVTKAKQQVSSEGIPIDFPAGPSEVMVVADASANPAFVAADLLSQAEHGEDSQVVLVALDPHFAKSVKEETERQLSSLPRRAIAARSLANGWIAIMNDTKQAMALANAYAPEHLVIQTGDAEALANLVIHAGSVFIGAYSPEAAGDYASGTNHTLPTGGYARQYGGLSCDSFIKRITFQQLTRKGLSLLAPSVKTMAEAEDLMGHREAVSVRLKS